MPAYEATFSPPAPVARALVRGPGGRFRSNVPLLIDTAADVSLVPAEVARDVGAQVRSADTTIQLLDGGQIDADVADLTLEILRYRFQVQCLVVEAPYGVLGRNILNLLVLSLDGPARTWSLSTPT